MKKIILGGIEIVGICSENHEDLRKLICVHNHEDERLCLTILPKMSNDPIQIDVKFCPICGFSYQPERLNPEDASNSVCDSLNNMGTC